MKKECKFCFITTKEDVSDFDKIGWKAVLICACPKHAGKLEKGSKNE